MTIIRGGPAGPDGAGGAYDNEVETDRSAWWYALGGRQGVLKGFAHSGVAGTMALDFTAGAATAGERDANGAATFDRGYLIWADVTTRVTFGTASASARNDAVVAAFVDTEDGPVGTGGLEVGGHLVVVPGVSGTTTPRTDADINAWLGKGGWVRLMDVPIASTDTEINVANIVVTPESTGAKHRARSERATLQPIDHNTTVDLAFTAHPYDVGLLRSGNTFVPRRAGLYTVKAHATFASNTTGSRRLLITVNGNIVAREDNGAPPGTTGLGATYEATLAAGDVVKAQVLQTSGAALDVTWSWLTIREIA